MNARLKKFILLLLLLIVSGGLFFYLRSAPVPPPNPPITNTPQLNMEEAVKNYVIGHISELSPQKEVLGGKFYVTKITTKKFLDGSIIYGDVSYEDGHNGYSATFAFNVLPDKTFSLKSFSIK